MKLQHRGQESSGICVGANFQTLKKECGLVKDVFENLPSELTGNFGIGHVRYSTQGKSGAENAQPFLLSLQGEQVSIAHNGNIKLENNSISDTKIMLETVAAELKTRPDNWSFEEIGISLNKNFSHGAYSVVFYLPSRIIAYRDVFGYRPLFFCEAEEGFFVASEDVAFEMLNPIKIIEINAGFGVEITKNGYEIKQFAQSNHEKKCIFEPIYFSSPKSNVFGMDIYKTRVALGKICLLYTSEAETV